MVLIPGIQFPKIAILTSQGARGHDQIHPGLLKKKFLLV